MAAYFFEDQSHKDGDFKLEIFFRLWMIDLPTRTKNHILSRALNFTTEAAV